MENPRRLRRSGGVGLELRGGCSLRRRAGLPRCAQPTSHSRAPTNTCPKPAKSQERPDSVPFPPTVHHHPLSHARPRGRTDAMCRNPPRHAPPFCLPFSLLFFPSYGVLLLAELVFFIGAIYFMLAPSPGLGRRGTSPGGQRTLVGSDIDEIAPASEVQLPRLACPLQLVVSGLHPRASHSPRRLTSTWESDRPIPASLISNAVPTRLPAHTVMCPFLPS